MTVLKTWFEVRSEETLIQQKGSALLVVFTAFSLLALFYMPYVMWMPRYEGRRAIFMLLLVVVDLLFFVCMAVCRRGHLDAAITMIMVTVGCGIWANSVPLGEIKSSLFALVMINLLGGFAVRRRQLLINVTWSAFVLIALGIGLHDSMDTGVVVGELIRAGCLVIFNSYLAYELSRVHGRVVKEYEQRRDLTRQKMEQVQQQRELAEIEWARAESASKMKGDFLANISHELRTPLNAILGYSEMLHEEFSESLEELPESLLQDTARVHVAGRHLLELIQDVLNLSDIESGELKMKMRRFDLEALIQEVMISMELTASMQDNVLHTETMQAVGEMESDPVWVRQVLFNMLSNAIKFTRGGTITTRSGQREDGKLFIAVEDTGIGMSEQEQARVFEEFVQANAQTLREFGGTGLGLSLCYKLAREMNGGLTIHSVKGEGTHIVFYFEAESSLSEVSE